MPGKKGILNRKLTAQECPGLLMDFEAGTAVGEFTGWLYHCASDTDVAVFFNVERRVFENEGVYEIPKDAITWFE